MHTHSAWGNACTLCLGGCMHGHSRRARGSARAWQKGRACAQCGRAHAFQRTHAPPGFFAGRVARLSSSGTCSAQLLSSSKSFMASLRRPTDCMQGARIARAAGCKDCMQGARTARAAGCKDCMQGRRTACRVQGLQGLQGARTACRVEGPPKGTSAGTRTPVPFLTGIHTAK